MASKINVDKIARGSGTPEFTIPTADGTAGQFLKTDGSGVLAFDTVTTNPLTLTGSTNNTITTVTGANALAGEANLTYDGTSLGVKNAGTASDIKVYCENANSHYTSIKSAAHAAYTGGSWTMTLPGTDGAANEFLQTDGAGATTWAIATPAARYVYAWRETSNQSIAASTLTLAQLNGVTQSHTSWDASTWTWTATADDAGIWRFNAQASYYTSTNNNNQPMVFIYLNGAKTAGSYSMAVVGLRHVTVHQQYLVDISTSDTIQMYGQCDLASFFFGGDTSGGPKQCSLLGQKL